MLGLFASLMSTLDSIYNSVSTLWSVDVYKRHLRPDASEQQIVRAGKLAIVATLISGVLFSFVVVYVKYGDLQFPLTHWFNELSYYVKNGFVMLVLAAVFLVNPSKRLVLATLLGSVAVTYLISVQFPDMNYFVRSGWTIVLTFALVAVPTMVRNGWRIPLDDLLHVASRNTARFGVGLAGSLVICHVVFH